MVLVDRYPDLLWSWVSLDDFTVRLCLVGGYYESRVLVRQPSPRFLYTATAKVQLLTLIYSRYAPNQIPHRDLRSSRLHLQQRIQVH